MQIVTAGRGYIDIDSYAGCIAYAELLRLQGQAAEAVCTSAPNQSVPPSLRALPVKLKSHYKPHSEDKFTLIDVSHPDFFDQIVNPGQVTQIIDHHPGEEDYWRKRIGEASHIEFVGAACTLVVEHWEGAGLLEKISPTTAKLLACGILDNTLNFRAVITTARDHAAYSHVAKIAALPAHWPETYLRECQTEVEKDVPAATRDDLKRLWYPSLGTEVCAGQIVLWDGAGFAHAHEHLFKHELAKELPEWYMNIVDLKEGRSYFVTDHSAVKGWLSRLLGVKFEGNIAKSDRPWLRKEITKADITPAR